MHHVSRLAAFGLLIGIPLWLHGLCLPALAKHRIAMGAYIEADPSTVREIQKTFHRAEHALEAEDLDALMAVYADSYENLGLTKDDMKTMWGNLFSKYRRFVSNHSFAQITVTLGEHPRAEVICSGSLWATSRETRKRESIDSWLWEMHVLVREDGAWRIRGPGKDVLMNTGFGATIHSLF